MVLPTVLALTNSDKVKHFYPSGKGSKISLSFSMMCVKIFPLGNKILCKPLQSVFPIRHEASSSIPQQGQLPG